MIFFYEGKGITWNKNVSAKSDLKGAHEELAMNIVKGGEKGREASCSTAAPQILIRTHCFAFGIQ